MVAQFQVTITDQIHKRADRLAKLSGRTVEEMLPVMLMLSAPAFSHPLNLDHFIADMPDEDVLALANLQMLPDIDTHHRELLELQRQDKLSEEQITELKLLTDLYGIGLAYKAEALAQSVKRGLLENMDS